MQPAGLPSLERAFVHHKQDLAAAKQPQSRCESVRRWSTSCSGSAWVSHVSKDRQPVCEEIAACSPLLVRCVWRERVMGGSSSPGSSSSTRTRTRPSYTSSSSSSRRSSSSGGSGSANPTSDGAGAAADSEKQQQQPRDDDAALPHQHLPFTLSW
jgi:hypothetical protein